MAKKRFKKTQDSLRSLMTIFNHSKYFFGPKEWQPDDFLQN